MVFANPRHFGRRRNAPTDPTCGLSDAEVAWALFQHLAATSVVEELNYLGRDYRWFAKRLGVNAAWLLRKLRGHVPADLGEILTWGLVLGVHVLPAIDDPETLSL